MTPRTMTAPGAAQVQAAYHDAKLANALYHDYQADSYDDKWSISFDARCVDYARDRFAKVAGTTGWPYPDALEIGCGTGFFSLNLKQAGVLGAVSVTDISPAMVQRAVANAHHLGFAVSPRVCDADTLPYPDASFDVVVGHAMLHHLPDPTAALREVVRVLRPGGRFVFAGEPTYYGDKVARALSRATWRTAIAATRLPPLRRWSRPPAEPDASSAVAALESVVDLHTFRPAQLHRIALAAGGIDVRVRTEEFLAAWFGWPARTLEYAVNPDRLGFRWAMANYRIWRVLSRVDETLVARLVPRALFYNALLSGVAP